MEELLAKRREDDTFQTLAEHIADCQRILEFLLQSRVFAEFCGRWNVDIQQARENLRWAVRLHDVGKASVDFQRAIRENKKSNISHRLLALPIAYDILKEEGIKDILGEDEQVLILALILAHHSSLHSQIFQQSEILGTVQLHPAIRQLFPSIKNLKIEIKEAKIMVENLKDKFDKLPEEEIVRVKSIFTYFLSLIKLSDWLASKSFNERTELQIPTFSPPPKEEILKGKALYPFQKELSSSTHPWLLLTAPCGRGKTEGAILWFLNLWERGEAERLIFAMPTQVTSNAMRNRLAELFGEENVALYHGRSLLEQVEIKKLQIETGEEYEEEDLLPLLREENLWGEVMAKPVVVTTVDHILFSFLHGFPQADFAFGNLQTSAIVFDEVHAYDDLMLSNLREAFKLLREMKIPHLLMSATFPRFLLTELRITHYPLIKDHEGDKIVRFSLKKREEPLLKENGELPEELLNELEIRYEKGEKQFLILNTVRKAQRVYRQIKERGLPALLLHSRFAYEHRRKKERLAMEALQKREPFILVATQVIEVSLDISSHTLYTELAPLDAIVQRAGRLNRYASQGEYKLYLFRPTEYDPYREKKEIIDKGWELLEERAFSQGDLVELVSSTYEGTELKKPSKLPQFFRQTVVFGHSPEEMRFSEEEGKAFRTRDIECPTIDVIPFDILAQLKEKNIHALLRYLTPVPLWWVVYSQKEKKDLFYPYPVRRLHFLICRLPYTEEIGFEEEKLGEISPSQGGVIID